jgi:hypothetical protein
MLLVRLFLLLVVCAAGAAAQNIAVTGTVRDAATREPVAGATIRVLGGTRGTYSASGGTFRLPLAPGTHHLVVSSIGFESDTVSVSTSSPRVEVMLRATTLELGGVAVTAELTADDVVRSAILRKEENLARLKTVNGLLYSKMSLDIDGNAFGQIKDEDRAIILETFSRYYYDREESPPIQIDVLNRRQTANIPSEGNLFALGNFVSFYEDELPLLNARVMTPLAEDAFSRYRFEFAGRSVLAGETVFIIRVIPTTRVLPAFEGTMKIVKGTYNLVEVDLRPTEATAIAFVRDLRFVQRFERLAADVWYPTFLEITGAATVEIVKGFATIDAKVHATSIVSEATVNEPIPDSVFARRGEDGRRSVITAAADADSARSEFWENNALSELSEEEKETYARIDSLVAEADTTARQEARGVTFGFKPNIDFNRVGGVSLFGGGDVGIGSVVDIGATGGYSFGLRRAIGEANATITPFAGEGTSLALTGSLFSRLGMNRWDRAIPKLVNSAAAALVHRDYYDWYREDGWSAGARGTLGELRASVGIEMARHFGEFNHVARSIFLREPFRANPVVDDASYRTLDATLAFGRGDGDVVISSGSEADIGVRIGGILGEETRSGATFRALEGRLRFETPTFGTGYMPMLLTVAAHAGIGTEELPLEYQFRMRTALSVVSPLGHFMSAPIGLYGGTDYMAFHAEHNFSDLLWRWIGLPTYWGRGVELIVSGATGRYGTKPIFDIDPTSPPQPQPPSYMATGDEWYSEVGVGLGRIPTFISNVAFLRLDARFGIGRLARGNWGVAVGLTSPF